MAKPDPPQMDLDKARLKEQNILEEVMQFIGFELEHLSADCVEGRFIVSKKSCQPFNVLHGGVSALIAEALASRASYIASGFQRIAGIELSINHLKAAPIGTEVFASAKAVHLGKRLHVWDVTLWKLNSSTESPSALKPHSDTKLAVSRVTLMVGLTGVADDHDELVKALSRL